MKLTWFGDTALRVHIGGQIVVIDADAAGQGVDRTELCSGADAVLALDGPHAEADASTWRPRAARRLLDAGDDVRPVEFWSMGLGALLVAPDDDMPLLVLGGAVPKLGRWVEHAVVLMVGPDLATRAKALLEGAAPRLIALAGEEAEIDAAIDEIRDRLDGTGLLALERGLAVEA